MFRQFLEPARPVTVWVVLVLATVVSWIFGHDHAKSIAGIGVLVIAIAKVRYVGLDFMELRHAPWGLRAAFEGYCGALGVVLICMYAWA